MAAAKLKAYWDQDIYDHHILIIEKNRGKLNQDEEGCLRILDGILKEVLK